MSITMQFLLLVVAACVFVSEGAAEGQVARAKQQRPIRGFRNPEMMTARGFGKRGRVSTRTERDVSNQTPPERSNRGTPTFKSPSVGIARDFGKRTPEVNPEAYGLDNFWEMLENADQREGQEFNEDKLESIPLDWFVTEMLNNPDFARSVVRKFIDLNKDGMLTTDELIRNMV